MRAMAAPIEAGSETLALQVTATYELIAGLTGRSCPSMPARSGPRQRTAAVRSPAPAVTAGASPAAWGRIWVA